MRTGIWSPVINLAGERPEWEQDAGIAEVVRIAQEADRLGYDFLTCSDHVAVPAGMYRGERFYDPLSTFAYLAGRTERIRFLPYLLVLPFYHPLELAKRYGTLDHISEGRLILGVGIGNLAEEFDALNVPFADRGPRADDALCAIRAVMSKRVVSYSGKYYNFENLVVDPHARQQQVPIWVGGHSRRALHRAVTLADGWAPPPLQFNGPATSELKQILAEVDLPPRFDVVVGADHPLDPIGNAAEVVDVLGACRDAGGTVFMLTVVNTSLAHYLDQLRAFAEI